jgi:hypothetical protein
MDSGRDWNEDPSPRFDAMAVGSWCKGSRSGGFDVVVGDPSSQSLPRSPGDQAAIEVRILGSCRSDRELEAVWDAEAMPIHPWGGRLDLPSRGEVRGKLDPFLLTGPIVGVLPVSWARNLLIEIVREARPRHASGMILSGPEGMIGCDLVVCAAGWGPVLEARASGVPYVAVDLKRRDHWLRATHDVRGASEAVQRVERFEDLDDDSRPWLPDFSGALLDLVEASTRTDFLSWVPGSTSTSS